MSEEDRWIIVWLIGALKQIEIWAYQIAEAWAGLC